MKLKFLILSSFSCFLCLIGFSQSIELPKPLFYKTENHKFLTTKNDTLVTKDYPDFELYKIYVQLDSFFFNKNTKQFRIVGKTLLDEPSGSGLPQIEILKKNGIIPKTFKKIGQSADLSDEKHAGFFDVLFYLQPNESLLFYLGGVIHAEYNLNQLFLDNEFLDIINEKHR